MALNLDQRSLKVIHFGGKSELESLCTTLQTVNSNVRSILNRFGDIAGCIHPKPIFTVRRSALHGICYSNSVRPSVRLSVCLSVTLVDCVHTIRPTIIIFSPYGSPIILVSGDIKLISKFEGGHPERGR